MKEKKTQTRSKTVGWTDRYNHIETEFLTVCWSNKRLLQYFVSAIYGNFRGENGIKKKKEKKKRSAIRFII